jgi:uncharacterized membrane protein YphA (DoxX/SURF4 family)
LFRISEDSWNLVARTGRLFITVALIGLGIQNFIYRGLIEGIEILPRWLPGHTALAYAVGTLLIAAGICISTGRYGRLAATALGCLFLFTLIFRDGPTIAAIVPDLRERTRFFEGLTICGGLFVLAATIPDLNILSPRWAGALRIAGEIGRICFALSMAVFGWSHLIIPAFIASLIPAWIPWHIFWVYATAAVFFAAAISIVIKRFMRITASMLGLMLFLWVVVLHGPRVAAALHNGDEWNSLFVALAISGFSLIFVGSRSALRGRWSGSYDKSR